VDKYFKVVHNYEVFYYEGLLILLNDIILSIVLLIETNTYINISLSAGFTIGFKFQSLES
jgi:hypothetical protein